MKKYLNNFGKGLGLLLVLPIVGILAIFILFLAVVGTVVAFVIAWNLILFAVVTGQDIENYVKFEEKKKIIGVE